MTPEEAEQAIQSAKKSLTIIVGKINEGIAESEKKLADLKHQIEAEKDGVRVGFLWLLCLHYQSDINNDKNNAILLQGIENVSYSAIMSAARLDEVKSKIPALQNIDNLRAEVDTTLQDLRDTAQKIKDRTEEQAQQDKSPPTGVYK